MQIDFQRYLSLSGKNTLFSLEAIAPVAIVYEALVFLEPWGQQELAAADPFVSSLLGTLGRHSPGLIYLLALFLAHTSATLEQKRESESPRPFFVLIAALEGALAALLLAGAAYFILPRWGGYLPPEEVAALGPTLALATGFSEELVFRFFLQGGIALLLREVVSLRQEPSHEIALPVAAILVALAHQPNLTAASFLWPSFLFHFLVPGLLFGYLYQQRGLAFVVYLHSMYHLFRLALPII